MEQQSTSEVAAMSVLDLVVVAVATASNILVVVGKAEVAAVEEVAVDGLLEKVEKVEKEKVKEELKQENQEKMVETQ